MPSTDSKDPIAAYSVIGIIVVVVFMGLSLGYAILNPLPPRVEVPGCKMPCTASSVCEVPETHQLFTCDNGRWVEQEAGK